MIRDLRQAWRILMQSKGWTVVILLSLALGIGVTTTLFSAINALLLKTLSVPEPDRLVRLRWGGDNPLVSNSSEYGYTGLDASGKRTRSTFSYPSIHQLRIANQTLTGILACAPNARVSVVVGGEAELATSLLVSGNYFQVLGLQAVAGRAMSAEDDQPTAAPVAMISYGYWTRRFGRDPGVVGLEVTVNQTPLTIIGVAPPGYHGIQELGDSARDLHIPLCLDERINQRKRLNEPTHWWLQLVGRLKPGVTREQVQGNLNGVFAETVRTGWETRLAALTPEQRSRRQNPDRKADARLEVSSASRGIYDPDPDSAQSISILGVVVVLVLVIVCANVANLLLSRSVTRRKEIAVRMFVGATRIRLIRQLLTEGLLLSTLGGGLALLVAFWSRRLLPFGLTPPLDPVVFGFAAGTSCLTGLAFAISPAMRGTRLDLAESLKENSRTVSRSKTTLSKFLLVVQVALSVVLLIGAGLFLRTLHNLRSVDVGFETENLLLVPVNPSVNQYEPERSKQILNRMEEAFRAIPGVRSVSLSLTPLLSGSTWTRTIVVPGREEGKPDSVYMMTVSPAFFDTMAIPIRMGRGFTPQDSEKAPRVAVINEAAAREFFPGESPLGRRFGFSTKEPEAIEVIGMIADTKYDSVRESAPPTLYTAWLQEGSHEDVTFELRTAIEPASLVGSVREAARRVDSSLPLGTISTQAEQVENNFSSERTFALAYSLFGALSLLLACIGLFGLMSYNVVQRTNEIGVRMALGAIRRDIVMMVLRESLLLVAVGVLLGWLGSLAAARLVATLLFDVAPADPATWLLVPMLMMGVATVAGYLPARRASRVDPLMALREE